MSGTGRANRLANDPTWKYSAGACDDGEDHHWQPLSFVFESQLLDKDGRVLIRQPDIDAARVYCVCMACHSHTYIVTEWAGFFVQSPREDALEEAAARE